MEDEGEDSERDRVSAFYEFQVAHLRERPLSLTVVHLFPVSRTRLGPS